MDNYKRFVEWVRLLSLFGAVFVADLVLTSLKDAQAPFLVSAIVIGLVVIATMHVLELLATYVFERIWVVRRFFLGDEHIEGAWFDNVVGKEQFGMFAIHFRDGRLFISGEQYDATGKVTATWEDYLVGFEGRTLHACYRAPQFSDKEPSEVYGFTKYVFGGKPGKPPTFFSGFFADLSGECRSCQLRGFRITDRNLLERLNMPESRSHAILELMGKSRALSNQPEVKLQGKE
jgi:hypothetical protein